MRVMVRSILGLGDIPNDRTAAKRWLVKAEVPVFAAAGDGRKPELVNLSDLPEPVRIAYTERQIAASGLASGTYDDAA